MLCHNGTTTEGTRTRTPLLRRHGTPYRAAPILAIFVAVVITFAAVAAFGVAAEDVGEQVLPIALNTH